jgi:dolichol-phosphate mannosyltransferase
MRDRRAGHSIGFCHGVQHVNITQAPLTSARDSTGSHDPSRDVLTGNAPLLSIVICTLDEHEAIGGVLHELDTHLVAIDHEIIVVDDSADERTGDVVNAYAVNHPHVRLIRRQRSTGLSSAAMAGWDIATGRFLAIMDGDGQHDPALMKLLLGKLADSSIDVAVASRYLDDTRSGLRGVRHTLSRAGTWLTSTTLGVPLADPLSGCFAMTRDWYNQVRSRLSGLGFKILIDVVASGQRRPHTAQVPTLLRERAGGESKLDARVAVDLITLLIEKRTQGRVTAEAIMIGMGLVAMLCAQWLSMYVLLKASVALLSTVFVAVGIGLAAHLMVVYVMTSRSLRPRSLGAKSRFWLRYYAGRWSDFLINVCTTYALCRWSCPWTLAALIGVALAEARYYFGKRAGARS